MFYNLPILTHISSIHNSFILMNHSDVWQTTSVDHTRLLLTPASPERQHPHAEDVLEEALRGRFGTLLGEGTYGRVYNTSEPELVVKQICNASGKDEVIGLTFDALEINIAASGIAPQLSLGKQFDRWRITAPNIYGAVVREEMIHHRHLNPPACPKPPENEHLFMVMSKLPLLPVESVQADICTDTFPSYTQIAAALAIGLRKDIKETIDISDSWRRPGLKTLSNMGILRTPGPNAEPGIIAVYDL